MVCGRRWVVIRLPGGRESRPRRYVGGGGSPRSQPAYDRGPTAYHKKCGPAESAVTQRDRKESERQRRTASPGSGGDHSCRCPLRSVAELSRRLGSTISPWRKRRSAPLDDRGRGKPPSGWRSRTRIPSMSASQPCTWDHETRFPTVGIWQILGVCSRYSRGRPHLGPGPAGAGSCV